MEGDKFREMVKVGAWYHYCMAWNIERLRIYINGQLMAQGYPKESTQLSAYGEIVIGNYRNPEAEDGFDWKSAFVGQVYGLNLFMKQLGGEDIYTMYKNGICSTKEITEYRILTWESILKLDRSNSEKGERVKYEVEIPECKEEPEPSNKWDILRKEDYFHRELTMDLYKKLISSCPYSMLSDFIGVKISDSFIKHLETCDGE